MILEREQIQLNIDGAISISNGSASIGGVFRDHCAKQIYDHTMRIGVESVFSVEVRTILKCLKIAQDPDFRQLEVKCDNTLIVETILVGGEADVGPATDSLFLKS